MAVTLPELVRQLSVLPPERVAELYDFVLFLKTRPAAAVDESDAWSDEDRRDAARASQHYAEAMFAAQKEDDD